MLYLQFNKLTHRIGMLPLLLAMLFSCSKIHESHMDRDANIADNLQGQEREMDGEVNMADNPQAQGDDLGVLTFVNDANNPDRVTPLHIAVHHGRTQIIRELLTHAARTDQADREGRTPLHYAAIEGYEEAVSILLQHGAAVDAREHDQRTPLHFAAKCGRAGVTRILLNNDPPARVNAVDPQGRLTPLHYAAAYDRVEVLDILLANGADLNAQASNGQTALDIARWQGHTRSTIRLEQASNQ